MDPATLAFSLFNLFAIGALLISSEILPPGRPPAAPSLEWELVASAAALDTEVA